MWHVYDLSGNLLSKTASPCPPGYPTYIYDAEDQMTSAPPSGVSYLYDGHGTRVERCLPNCTSPTAWTAYLFSGSQDIAEYDNGAAVSSPSREFIYSEGVPGSGLLASITGGSTLTYFHSDHLDWRVSTNASGQVTGQQGDYPYGESWYSQNGNQFVFTSYSRDTATGLDYAMARYYDSSAGRFGLPDPLRGSANDPQSWNRYAYVRNDPVDMMDPSGQSLLTDLISFAWGLFFQNHGMGLPGQPPPFGMPGGPSNGTIWNEHPPLYGNTPPGAIIKNWHADPNGNPLGLGDRNGEQDCGADGQHCMGLWWDSALNQWDPWEQLSPRKSSDKAPKAPTATTQSVPSCPAVFLNATANELMGHPMGPAGTNPEDMVSTGAATAATMHTISSGLVVPLRSGIVRGMLGAGELVSTAVAAAPVIKAEASALSEEYTDWRSGACSTIWTKP